MARQDQEAKPIERTLVDTILVSLSAANTLHQNLSKEPLVVTAALANEPLRIFADAAGRFADACEKIDHVEEFRAMACKANADIMSFALAMTNERGIDVNSQLKARRNELAARQFFVTE